MPASHPAAPPRFPAASPHPIEPAVTPPTGLHDAPPEDASRERRPLARVSRRPLRLAVVGTLAAGALIGTSACGGDSSAASTPSGVAASDASRIAQAHVAAPAASASTGRGNTSPSVSATATSAASTTATPRATTKPQPASTTRTTSVPSPSTLTIPDAAKAHTPDGAKAFVKFYWEALDVVAEHPTNHDLRAFYQADCRTCSLQQSGFEQLRKDGAHIQTTNRKLFDWSVRSDSKPDSAVITFHQTDGGNYKVSSNGTRTRFATNDLRVAVRADWINGRWLIGAAGADKS